jgi:hypothetical protein
MEFVSKDQTYEALRKLLIENGLEDLARQMQKDGDRSRDPELYKDFLDTLRSDPLEPQTALESVAQFLEENVAAGAPGMRSLIESAKQTAQDPEKGDRALWNHWIELLASV